MAASKYLNHAQLQMFMPARTLFNELTSLDAGASPLSKVPQVVEQKRQDNRSAKPSSGTSETPFLEKSIKEEGIKYPVVLGYDSKILKPLVANGNHRIVAAHDIDPNMEVPVTYHPTHNVTGGFTLPPQFYGRSKSEEKMDEKYFAPRRRARRKA